MNQKKSCVLHDTIEDIQDSWEERRNLFSDQSLYKNYYNRVDVINVVEGRYPQFQFDFIDSKFTSLTLYIPPRKATSTTKSVRSSSNPLILYTGKDITISKPVTLSLCVSKTDHTVTDNFPLRNIKHMCMAWIYIYR